MLFNERTEIWEIMNLRTVISTIETFDSDFTIYIEGGRDWSLESQALVAARVEDGAVPKLVADQGYEYFLEVYIAVEVIDVWKQWHGGTEPSVDQKCAAVIHYA